MKAILKNYRQSPRKVRTVAKILNGKSVPSALGVLRSVDKKVSEPIHKLIRSAVNNAAQKGVEVDNLIVQRVVVDAGMVLKRYRPRAFGRSTPIRRRTSSIRVELSK